ncbi:YjcZ family sporulation protein [Paenibacillus sp. BJ-4]|nr:YjcZ family sporulation protein [Paenibacillus sp. BJ-4]
MSHMCGVGGMHYGVGAWTSIGAILVLFILLVIISKTLFL